MKDKNPRANLKRSEPTFYFGFILVLASSSLDEEEWGGVAAILSSSEDVETGIVRLGTYLKLDSEEDAVSMLCNDFEEAVRHTKEGKGLDL